MDVFRELSDLKMPRALSRVGLAAMQHKHGGAVNQDYVTAAMFLRAQYKDQLAHDDAMRQPPTPKPADPFLASLWEIGRKNHRPMPKRKRALIERLLFLLDKFIEGTWTPQEAARCMAIIVKLTPR